MKSENFNKMALIAGMGTLPLVIAKKLSDGALTLESAITTGDENAINAIKHKPLILAIRDDWQKFKPFADKLVHLRAPSLGKGIREMKNWGAESVIMAGGIPKKVIYCLSALLDPVTRSVLAKSLRDDHSLLGSVVSALEREGIRVIPYWQILPEFLAPEGLLSQRKPTESELADIDYGKNILRVTLPCSFGQSIVIADRAVVAIESMEGTDATITRAGGLVRRGVLVKMMRRDQDLRYDLPTVGPRTIHSMHDAGLTCLAIEAARTLILEPEETFALADKFKIAVVGIMPE